MITGDDWSAIERPKEPDLNAYFRCYGSLFGVTLTPFNLGLYRNMSNELRSAQYIGVMPLLQDDLTPVGDEVISIKSRFSISPTEMLTTVLGGIDYYEHPEMLTFRFYTPEEWKELPSKGRNFERNKVLCGIVKGLGTVDLPQNVQGDENGGQAAVLGGELTIFEIMQFVACAKEVCKRSLKRQSRAREENLNGKVKGRILINKQIKHNLSRGQQHMTYCAYNAMSENITENEILKYTLYLCEKSPVGEALGDDLLFCKRALDGVRLRKCGGADFVGLKTNGAFRYYKDALDMARRILDKCYIAYETGKDGKGEQKFKQRGQQKVEPYFIDMNLLFEYYCRALFREAIDDKKLGLKLEAPNKPFKLFGAGSNNVKAYFMERYIPDILLLKEDGKPWAVIDAKYSNVGESAEKRSRTHQVLFYMNALDCGIGGLIGVDEIETKAYAGQYCYGGASDSRQRLVFIPLGKLEEQNRDASQVYVERIKGLLGDF